MEEGRGRLESFCTCHPESPSHETELLPPLASTRYWLLVYTPPDPQLFLSRKLRLRTFVPLNRANSVALTQDFRNGTDDSTAEFIADLTVSFAASYYCLHAVNALAIFLIYNVKLLPRRNIYYSGCCVSISYRLAALLYDRRGMIMKKCRNTEIKYIRNYQEKFSLNS